MYQGMVEGRIEHRLLFLRPAGHADPSQRFTPTLPGGCHYPVEFEALLFRIQIHPCILDAHKGNSHLDHQLLSFLQILVTEPIADVVSGKFA